MNAYINYSKWPSLELGDPLPMQSLRSQRVQKNVQRIIDSMDIPLSHKQGLSISDGAFFDRIALKGWTGLMESYLANEWDSNSLSEILSAFLTHPLQGSKIHELIKPFTQEQNNLTLVTHNHCIPITFSDVVAGPGRSVAGAIFASGPRTMQLVNMKHGKNKKLQGRPVAHSVAQPPVSPELDDLAEAQNRRIDLLLDEAHIKPGERILELPSSGGELARKAARRGARADIVTTTQEEYDALTATIWNDGLSGAVGVYLIDSDPFNPIHYTGYYDAIFCIEHFEHLAPARRVKFFDGAQKLLVRGGQLFIQSLINKELNSTEKAAILALRQYMWPHLDFPTVDTLAQNVPQGLEMHTVLHFGSHYMETMRLLRQALAAGDRDIAIAGFDPVYRKVWDFYFALIETLLSRDSLDSVWIGYTRN